MMNIIWLYGLSGSGKSTLANALQQNYDAIVIDSDLFRHAWPGLGFDDDAKKQRAANLLDVAKRLKAPRTVVACITPFESSRIKAKGYGALLVYIDTSIKVCKQSRASLYNSASDLAGHTARFDPPHEDDIRLKRDKASYMAGTVAQAAGWMD